jgi:hypothetical protein
MCRNCVAALSTISPILNNHLKERFVEVMQKDLMAFDEPHVPFLIGYEIHAEALKATIDSVLMDEITNMMIQAMTGDFTGIVELMGESTDFQKEWA